MKLREGKKKSIYTGVSVVLCENVKQRIEKKEGAQKYGFIKRKDVGSACAYVADLLKEREDSII